MPVLKSIAYVYSTGEIISTNPEDTDPRILIATYKYWSC
jgi:hypothetical protein